MAKTILILAANPKDTLRLRLDEEFREISDGLQRSKKRDDFILTPKFAPKTEDVRRAMLDSQPNIVHFCGHGTGEAGLAFEDDQGNAQVVAAKVLADFFGLFAHTVECVVLNACYSEIQAEAIARHINYVVGMKKEIEDGAAIKFAVAFYDALEAGESIEFSYNLACNSLQWMGLSDNLTPVLINRDIEVGKLFAELARLRERKSQIRRKLNECNDVSLLEEYRREQETLTIQTRSLKAELEECGESSGSDPIDDDSPSSYPIEITRPNLRGGKTVGGGSDINKNELLAMLIAYLRRVEVTITFIDDAKMLDEPPYPNSNTIGILVDHIAGAAEEWVCGYAGGMQIDRNRNKEFERGKVVTIPELITRLREVQKEIETVFAKLNDDDFRREVQASGKVIDKCTILWCLVHAIEHTAYHFAEMDAIINFCKYTKTSLPPSQVQINGNS